MKYNGITLNKAIYNGEQINNILKNGNTIFSNAVTDGLVLWLDGNDFVSGSAWHDRMGISDGIPSNCSSDGSNGVIFNGTTSKCDTGFTIYNMPSFTICVRLKVKINSTKHQTVFEFYNSSAPSITNYIKMYITKNTGSISTQILGSWASDGSDGVAGAQGKVFSDNEIVDVVLMKNGTIFSVYFNGTYNYSFDAETRIITINADSTCKIGYKNVSEDSFFGSKIYNFQAYNRILSNAEILQNHNANIYVPTPTLRTGSFLIGNNNIGEVV